MRADVVALVGVIVAAAWRGRPLHTAPATPRPGRAAWTVTGDVGVVVVARVPWIAPAAPRPVGVLILCVVPALLVVGWPALPLAAVAVVVLRRRAGLAADRRLDAEAEVLASFAHLLRIALAAGLSPAAAVIAAQGHLRSRVTDAGLAALARELARGRPFAAASADWAGRHPSVGELAAVLGGADRTGAAVGASLVRLAASLRRRRRRAAERRARRLPVSMLLPLVVCILPAFVLVTVVPLVAVGLDALA